MINKTEMKVVAYKETMSCDWCADGEMIYGNTQLCSYPPQYPHTCNVCKASENYLSVYPSTHIKAVEIDQ